MAHLKIGRRPMRVVDAVLAAGWVIDFCENTFFNNFKCLKDPRRDVERRSRLETPF